MDCHLLKYCYFSGIDPGRFDLLEEPKTVAKLIRCYPLNEKGYLA